MRQISVTWEQGIKLPCRWKLIAKRAFTAQCISSTVKAWNKLTSSHFKVTLVCFVFFFQSRYSAVTCICFNFVHSAFPLAHFEGVQLVSRAVQGSKLMWPSFSLLSVSYLVFFFSQCGCSSMSRCTTRHFVHHRSHAHVTYILSCQVSSLRTRVLRRCASCKIAQAQIQEACAPRVYSSFCLLEATHASQRSRQVRPPCCLHIGVTVTSLQHTCKKEFLQGRFLVRLLSQ